MSAHGPTPVNRNELGELSGLTRTRDLGEQIVPWARTSAGRDYLRVHVYGQTIFVLAGITSPSSTMTAIGTFFSASGNALIE